MAGWSIIPERSSVRYAIRHLGIFWSRGRFRRPQGQIMLDSHLAQTYLYGAVPVENLRTGFRLRDEVLKGSRYFFEQEHPMLSYVAYEVVQGRHPSHFVAKGELSVRGLTQPVEIAFRISKVTTGPEGKIAHFKSEFTLRRDKLGIGGNSWTLGQQIRVQIAVQARKS